MKRKLLIVLPFLYGVLLISVQGFAVINMAASCSQADVQKAVNSAGMGDTVLTPGPCSAAWAAPVSIPNTVGITVDGGGNTTLTNFGFTINQSNSGATRVTGFAETNGAPAANTSAWNVVGSTSSSAGRIDHNTFSSSAGRDVFVKLSGNGPFLIDNNVFTDGTGGADEFIHNEGMGGGNAAGWSDGVAPGGASMVFIEDNTFNGPGYNGCGNPPCYFVGTSAVQSYYGARTVFRHNTLRNVQIDQHGSCGAVGARWWEIYENNWILPAGVDLSAFMAIRDGSGVIFNNHQTGTNCCQDPPPVIEITNDCTTGAYPLKYQVGLGIDQLPSPAYLWGNDSTMKVVSGNTTYVQPGRDFMLSSVAPSSMAMHELSSGFSSAYTPYTYPHPLQGTTSATAPDPPVGLAAVVQ